MVIGTRIVLAMVAGTLLLARGRLSALQARLDRTLPIEIMGTLPLLTENYYRIVYAFFAVAFLVVASLPVLPMHLTEVLFLLASLFFGLSGELLAYLWKRWLESAIQMSRRYYVIMGIVFSVVFLAFCFAGLSGFVRWPQPGAS